jgi:hypothetical protein
MIPIPYSNLSSLRSWRLRSTGGPYLLSLFFTCRQIYTETALLPYRLKVFNICEPYIRKFLSKRSASQLNTITLLHISSPNRLHARNAESAIRWGSVGLQWISYSFLSDLPNVRRLHVIFGIFCEEPSNVVSGHLTEDERRVAGIPPAMELSIGYS